MFDDFWLNRWKAKDTPWQQRQIETLLVKYFPKDVPRTALVPLCGKSLDMIWLLEQGHRVIGVELSEIAAKDFFEENKIKFEAKETKFHKIFTAKNISIWAGDFFKLTPEEIGPIDAIYDRAALFALPEELRKEYTAQLTNISKTCGSKKFEMLLLSRDTEMPDKKGPPYMVTQKDIEDYYRESFSIEVLEKMTKTPGRSDLPKEIIETAYRLKLKSAF